MEGGCCPVFTVSLSYQPALNRRQLCQISVLEGFSGEPVKIHHSHTKQAISCHTDFFPLTPSSSNQLIDIELKNRLIYFKCAFFLLFVIFLIIQALKLFGGQSKNYYSVTLSTEILQTTFSPSSLVPHIIARRFLKIIKSTHQRRSTLKANKKTPTKLSLQLTH